MCVTAQYPFTCNKRSTVTSHTSLHQTQTYHLPIVVKRSMMEQRVTQVATELSVCAYKSELNILLQLPVHRNTGQERLSLDLLQQTLLLLPQNTRFSTFRGIYWQY